MFEDCKSTSVSNEQPENIDEAEVMLLMSQQDKSTDSSAQQLANIEFREIT